MKICEIIRDKYKLRIPPTVYYELLADVVEAEEEQEPKSEWEHDHEILKAYSDGANEVLDKIRAEIEQLPIPDTAIRLVTEILDKYKAESEDNE